MNKISMSLDMLATTTKPSSSWSISGTKERRRGSPKKSSPKRSGSNSSSWSTPRSFSPQPNQDSAARISFQRSLRSMKRITAASQRTSSMRSSETPKTLIQLRNSTTRDLRYPSPIRVRFAHRLSSCSAMLRSRLTSLIQGIWRTKLGLLTTLTEPL